jgi:putative transcriptional regulator
VTLLRQTPAEATPETVPILDDIYVSTDPDWLAGVAARARNDTRLRLYAGHALWAPGQLEQEIEAGGWRVVQGHAALVFSATPLTLWTSLLEAPPEVQAGIATPPAATGERPGMTPRYAVRLLR